MHRVLRYHGIVSRYQPKDVQLPGNLKGGMDLHVMTNANYAVDVCIATSHSHGRIGVDRLTRAYQKKIRKYKIWSSRNCFTTIPFVMSSDGKIYYETIQQVSEWWSMFGIDAHLRFDIVSRTQFSLLRSTFLGYCRYLARENDNLTDWQLDEDILSSDDEIALEES